MNYLITTEPDDTHAVLVKLALEDRGHSVRLWFPADQPTKQKNSVFLDQSGYQWKCADHLDVVNDNNYDVVWWRRARKPYLPKEAVHADDHTFAERENRLFHESLTYNLAPDAWWINSKESAARANSKLLQLNIAVQCGMTIPLTLCSNDPKEIRYFLLKHETDGVIYKPLCSNFWFERDRTKAAYTSCLDFLDLPDNALLQVSPGIFQKNIRKKYELRVTCFGDYLVAARLHSQEHPDGQTDWRAIPCGEMTLEPYDLPVAVSNQIRAFMRRLGIVFGCMDLIVTPDDQYVFLEVNEQGQFFWIEDYNPDIRMLDIFVKFLLYRSVYFKWDERHREHDIGQYRDRIQAVASSNMKQHVVLNRVR